MNTNPDCSIQLTDGRTLGFSRFGVESAVPILLFHGIPGSRCFAFPAGSPMDDARLQVILPERPGYGLSDARDGRTMLGWAEDVAQLANALKLNAFHLLGLSGGGPYALACAHQMSERVLSVNLVASVAPLCLSRLRKAMALSNKLAYYVARFIPLAIRLNFLFNRYSLIHKPALYLEKLLTQLSDWDEALLHEPDKRALFLQHMREAYHQGIDGAVSDIQLLMKPWGFDLADITSSVRLWQGELDPMVPPAMGHYLAERLPNCKSKFIPGTGHLLFMDDKCINEILYSILDENKL